MGLGAWLQRRMESLIGFMERGKRARRRKVLEAPFPSDWIRILDRNAAFHAALSDAERIRLYELIRLFASEKAFVGCNGLLINDDVRVTVAAHACRLLLGRPDIDLFHRLGEIIIYPNTLRKSEVAIGPDGTRYDIRDDRSGEAWERGPVVLAWDGVRSSVSLPVDGYNVILHEFAHVLDFENGATDGFPLMPSREVAIRWAEVCTREFKELQQAARSGRRTFINQYGSEEPAEFFAVITEHFFEQPHKLKSLHPELYEVLSAFYAQDPAAYTRDVPRGAWLDVYIRPSGAATTGQVS